MRTMGTALLLLLVALACTAAGIDTSDGMGQESPQAEAIDELLTAMSEDADSVDDVTRRGIDPKSQGPEACLVYEGKSYRGKLSTTVTGKTCQRWADQTPQSHRYRPDKYASYGLDKNYCRNPSSTKAPWCYTMDLGRRWEICNVPGCDCVNYKGSTYRGTTAVTKSGKACQPWASQTPHKHRYTPVKNLRYGLDQNYCRNPSGSDTPWCYTTDPGKRWEECDIPGCECVEGTGSTYRGRVAVTESGRTCQRWDSKSPHKPNYKPPDGTDHNYCRQPCRSYKPWCYTTDPAKRWEYCDIPGCECRMGKGMSYRGIVAVTKTGRTCQRWDSKSPHKPSYKSPDGTDHNYCRNPSNAAEPWCYTTDPGKRWEYCDIPGCGKIFFSTYGVGGAQMTHFKVVNIRKTAADAKAYCRAEENGQLADVTSPTVQSFLLKTIQEYGSNSRNYWVGLHDATGSGGWKWADGTPLSACSFRNWAPGEPGNIGGQQCVQLTAASGFQWDNQACSTRKYFICQTGPGDTDACGGLSGREVEADVDEETAFEAMRSSLLREEEELSDRTADKYRRSDAESTFHNLVRLADVKKALESEIEYGSTAMEKLNEISRELSEVWEEEDPDVDDDQADDIPREMSVVWEEQEADDVIAKDVSETEEEAGLEVDEDAIMEDIDGILEELREIVEEKEMEFEE
ncbi:LPA [Branchiostoma lanceolatum]|uniref:LPA protein n=1 Tax=Branchiostoma lanceolatum TaxID=7740 RepID=A0A8J9ZJ81_BRALA|nr:LPA [Branchiostoma lanceolatum]